MKQFLIVVAFGAVFGGATTGSAAVGLLPLGEDVAALVGSTLGMLASFVRGEVDKRLPDGVGRDPETGRFVSSRGE